MPLLDHSGPPLSLRRHWHAFHNAWATYLSSDLNRRLPEGYFAEPNVQFGIEIDVATWDERAVFDPASGGGRSATDAGVRGSAAAVWAPTAPARVVPISLLEGRAEVLVYDQHSGPTLAGAIELVSPANKDRPSQRDALVTKCASYVQQGVGLVLVDVVTGRTADLHRELLVRLGAQENRARGELYAVAYRPVCQDQETRLEVWEEPLQVGGALPTLPLWLLGGLCLPVELEATYQRTCEEQRVTA